MKPIVGAILLIMILSTDVALFIDENRIYRVNEKINALAENVGIAYVPPHIEKIPGKYYGD